MSSFSTINSCTLKLLDNDIDTDQMIPARFMRTASAQGLGQYLFYDRRFTQEGREILDFPLSSVRYQGESIILAGKNFGCGSSREHAPWALKEFGIKAIVSESFAEIFYSNCLLNGILPIEVNAEHHQKIQVCTGAIAISLEEQVLWADGWQLSFRIDPFARYCLLQGIDELTSILQREPAIAHFEQRNQERFPAMQGL